MKNVVNRALVAKKPIITFALTAVLAITFDQTRNSNMYRRANMGYAR